MSERALRAAYDSYAAHFPDPRDAAEKDLLGEALKVCIAYMRDCSCHFGGIGPEGLCAQPCELCADARALLAKVKP